MKIPKIEFSDMKVPLSFVRVWNGKSPSCDPSSAADHFHHTSGFRALMCSMWENLIALRQHFPRCRMTVVVESNRMVIIYHTLFSSIIMGPKMRLNEEIRAPFSVWINVNAHQILFSSFSSIMSHVSPERRKNNNNNELREMGNYHQFTQFTRSAAGCWCFVFISIFLHTYPSARASETQEIAWVRKTFSSTRPQQQRRVADGSSY